MVDFLKSTSNQRHGLMLLVTLFPKWLLLFLPFCQLPSHHMKDVLLNTQIWFWCKFRIFCVLLQNGFRRDDELLFVQKLRVDPRTSNKLRALYSPRNVILGDIWLGRDDFNNSIWRSLQTATSNSAIQILSVTWPTRLNIDVRRSLCSPPSHMSPTVIRLDQLSCPPRPRIS